MPRHIYKRSAYLAIFLLLASFSYVQAALININTVTLAELDTLPGVGPSVAQSIIDNRPYATVEEISRAAGIGEPGSSTYENIIGLITVGSSAIESEETAEQGREQGSSAPTYSELKPAAKVLINIGKDRTESVGSPIFFKAEVNVDKIQNGDFRWNFGDGLEGYGREVIHIYEYPGDYVVVFSLGSSGTDSARVNIKVAEQELIIAAANPEKIEIKNNSKHEANLFGKALVVGNSSFVFPQGTIIKSGATISFGSKVTRLTPTVPAAVNIFSLGTTEHPKFAQKIEEEKIKQVALIQSKIDYLRQQIARVSPPPGIAVEPEDNREEGGLMVESQTASAANSGWWSTLKKFFLKTK